MAYMKNKTGRRLDAFEVMPRSEASSRVLRHAPASGAPSGWTIFVPGKQGCG